MSARRAWAKQRAVKAAREAFWYGCDVKLREDSRRLVEWIVGRWRRR
jgi:hypothetical protein